MKTARQNIVNQSENGYGFVDDGFFNVATLDRVSASIVDDIVDDIVTCGRALTLYSNSIKCFETQDTNEKLRLTCGVTEAHCHLSGARSESDDWPVQPRFAVNSICYTGMLYLI